MLLLTEEVLHQLKIDNIPCFMGFQWISYITGGFLAGFLNHQCCISCLRILAPVTVTTSISFSYVFHLKGSQPSHLLGGGFKIFVIFIIPTWGRFPIWLIFFRWVETTNQFTFGYFRFREGKTNDFAHIPLGRYPKLPLSPLKKCERIPKQPKLLHGETSGVYTFQG